MYTYHFFLKMTVCFVGVMAARVVDMAGQSCGDTSADTWPSHEL